MFCDFLLSLVLKAWGFFFNELEVNKKEWNDVNYCNRKYNEFLKELNEYISQNKNSIEDAMAHIVNKFFLRNIFDFLIIDGITFGTIGISIVFPPAFPSAISALVDSGAEVLEQLKGGQQINWKKVFIKYDHGAVEGSVWKYIKFGGRLICGTILKI